MSDRLEVGHGVSIPFEEIEVRASRSGGPGGQHANKTASRIEAVFDVRASASLTNSQKERIAARLGPRVTAVSQDSRGQARNRAIALRRPTRPSRGAKERRLESKRQQSQRKQGRRRPPDWT